MSVVEIDERGRMTVQKKLGLKKTRALVIPASAFFITIPLPKIPEQDVENWLFTKKGRRELKLESEKTAREDAVKWARRRRQLC